VAYTMLISGLLGGWEQLNQGHFWFERACMFAGAFPGFVLVLLTFQAHRPKQQGRGATHRME
jgi:hypothetical protein